MRDHTMGATGLVAALVGSLFLTLPAMAQTYKWTDADGKIHYSDQPPPAAVKDESVIKRGKNAPPPPTAAAPGDKGKPGAGPRAATPQEQEAEFRKRQVANAEKEAAEKKKADDAAEKKTNCDAAKAQLANLQAGGRITRNNAKGEREFLSDAEVSQEIERGKKAAASWCN
ncbi:MAG: DUF4124 domain-containing protein [Betaproteobacteria bacterium]